jgi:methylmalonyl-CoA mutase C-terminal domain/subunit
MSERKKIRVVVAKPGLDGHDRGAKVVAYGLRDEGFEVIYTGLRQTPEQLARLMLQEDADVLGLSILSGAHLSLTKKIIETFEMQGVGKRLIILGGVIPAEDIPKLKEIGVDGIFTSGTQIKEIAQFIRSGLEALH